MKVLQMLFLLFISLALLQPSSAITPDTPLSITVTPEHPEPGDKITVYAEGGRNISDIIIPVEYLRLIFAVMNRIRNGIDIYTDEAYKKQKSIFIKIAQKVLRYTTEKEKERFALLQSLPF